MILNLRTIILTLAALSIYYVIFKFNIINYLALGSNIVFVDYGDIIKALNCVNFGYSSYSDVHQGPQEMGCRGFSYGPIIIDLIPFKKKFFIFYKNIFPIVLIILFSFLTIFIINPKKNLILFITFLSLFNPATLLMIQRMNIDILFVILLILISYNRIYPLNWFLVIFSFLTKFYPFIYGMIIFMEDKFRNRINLLIIFLLILFSSFFYMYLNLDKYSYIMNSSWAMGLHYLFSIKILPKIFKELFDLHYGFLLLLMFGSFIYFNIKLIKKNYKSVLNLDFSSQEKMFVLSSNVVIFCFIVFSNAYYREVFLILTIPYLLRYLTNHKLKIIINLLIIKLSFNFIYILFLNFETHYHVDGQRIYTNSFLFISFVKGIIDYLLILFISSIAMIKNIKLINHHFKFKFLEKFN